MAKSTLPSLPSLSPPPPTSSSSSAPTSPKESLPLQKKYAIVQEISKQKREKYGKMFIPPEFYASLRKKYDIPQQQQQQETIKLTKDKIKSRKKKKCSSKFLNQKINYRRPSFEMVEKVHQQNTKTKSTAILKEYFLSKSRKDTAIENACNNFEKCTCEDTSENSMINKETYADKTKVTMGSDNGSQFVVEKVNPFSYKIQKIDYIQNKNETTEDELTEISTLSMGLKEKQASKIKSSTITNNTRTQSEIIDSKPSFYSTSAGYYSKHDQAYHIQPNIRLSKQSISHPPIRAASFQHYYQPQKFSPIVLEPSYLPFEKTATVYDPRFRQEPGYFPYNPYSGPIYRGQFSNMYPRLPYRHIFPSLQREPVFYHYPSIAEMQQHQQYPLMDYYGYYYPHRPPPNHGIREMTPFFYPKNN